MKKILAILTAVLMLASCTALAEAVESVEMQTVKYVIYNNTGENVVMISITDNNDPNNTVKTKYTDEFTDEYFDTFEFSVPASEDGSHRLTLEFDA